MTQIDKKKAQGFIDKFEKLDDQAESIMGTAKAKVRPLREDQASIVEQAANALAISKSAFKGHLKERKLARKIEAIRDGMETDQQDELDSLKSALGVLADTPLGEAAAMAGKKRLTPADFEGAAGTA